MTDQHPITPPTELVHQWADMLSSHSDYAVFSLAAQWGADQELEACCKWLTEQTCFHPESDLIKDLRAARRPKPPSLKEQALALVSHDFSNQPCLSEKGFAIIRRALEALPND
jgi:hypothetical protein